VNLAGPNGTVAHPTTKSGMNIDKLRPSNTLLSAATRRSAIKHTVSEIEDTLCANTYIVALPQANQLVFLDLDLLDLLEMIGG
jgi:hypothetical protein